MRGHIFRIFIVLYTVYYGPFFRLYAVSRSQQMWMCPRGVDYEGDETRGHRRKMRLALADVISATV